MSNMENAMRFTCFLQVSLCSSNTGEAMLLHKGHLYPDRRQGDLKSYSAIGKGWSRSTTGSESIYMASVAKENLNQLVESTGTVSIVIPALNEEEAIEGVIRAIPKLDIESLGYGVQILVIDNGSTDSTARIARDAGADVVSQPVRGYGNAYKCGFSSVKGDIIATADADQTYPVEMIPRMVKMLEDEELDFITTNRFADMSPGAMSKRNKIGNAILNITCRMLYGISLIDSQSGMWVFRKSILEGLLLRSGQMPFSEELKIECIFYNKAKWKEIPIEYKDRVGEVKLRGWKDGLHNLVYMIKKRVLR